MGKRPPRRTSHHRNLAAAATITTIRTTFRPELLTQEGDGTTATISTTYFYFFDVKHLLVG